MTQTSARAHIVIAVTAIAILILLITLAMTEAASHEQLGGNSNAPWADHIRTLDQALAQKDISAAERALQQAYLAALGSRRWEGMVEVGDAALRIGEVSGFRNVSKAKARENYLAAFFRARQQRSLDGMLRVTEAFAALGDREVAQQVLRAAEGLATHSRDGQAGDRVRALGKQVAAGSLDRKSP